MCVCVYIYIYIWSQDSVVGLVTQYRLDSLGIKSQWRVKFSVPVQTGLRLTQPSIQWVLGLSRGGKWPGCGIGHPPTPSAEVKEYSYTSPPPLGHHGLF